MTNLWRGILFHRHLKVFKYPRFISTHHLIIGDENKGRKIAYREVPGQRQPTIVMVPGLHSYAHMNGMKAQCLIRYCDLNDYTGIIYDHECMGESTGDKKHVLFSHWLDDIVTVVEKLTEGPVVLVGSSMGGWLALLAAERLKQRIHGMVLFAPAMNYVYRYYQRHMEKLPKDIRTRLETGDVHVVAGSYGDALLKKDFAEDSLAYEYKLEPKSIDLHCPIRIIHGLEDNEVDPRQSMALCHALQSTNVDLIYRKTSEHQIESPPDLELFLNTLDRLMKDHPVRKNKRY